MHISWDGGYRIFFCVKELQSDHLQSDLHLLMTTYYEVKPATCIIYTTSGNHHFDMIALHTESRGKAYPLISLTKPNKSLCKFY